MSPNQFLPATYMETIWRLAAGLTPLSSLGGPGPLPGVELALERVPQPCPVPADAGTIGNYEVGIGLPTVRRNRTGRFAITYSLPTLTSPFVVRMYDTRRRYVPRRFSLPIPAQTTVIGQEQAADVTPWPPIPSRAFTPVLFPGANHGTQAGATVIRGTVQRGDGSAARWVRVAAVDANQSDPLGWAHGDDRGEFLLTIGSSDAGLVLPGSALAPITLTVSARPTPAAIDSPAQSTADPLWDLEVEPLPSPGTPDTVSDGQTPPADFSESVSSTITVVKGTVSHLSQPIVIP